MKTDLNKAFPGYYKAPARPQESSFDAGVYLTLEGRGEPGGTDFSAKTGALYSVAYGVKKLCKLRKHDFGVPKLEAFWWVGPNEDARAVPRSEWNWKLLIRVPDFVERKEVMRAIEEVVQRKKISVAADIHLEKLQNGRCVDVLHRGPYSEESKTIDLMHAFMTSRGLKPTGHHHEIYLSDPRKTAPSKMKTILRQGVS